MAHSTCDGSMEPAAQADPEETAMLARSSSDNSESASTSSKAILRVLGRRLSLAPFRIERGQGAESPAASRRAKRRSWASRCEMHFSPTPRQPQSRQLR